MPEAAFLICIKDSVFIDRAMGCAGVLIEADKYMRTGVTEAE